MWSDAERRSWAELDATAEKAGGYLASPKHPAMMDYDYPAMGRYAKAKGVTSFELTESERNIFKFDPPIRSVTVGEVAAKLLK